MPLTQQEREKFSIWLDNEARSNDAMIEQVKKTCANAIADQLERRLKAEAHACRIVAIMLRKIEDQSIT